MDGSCYILDGVETIKAYAFGSHQNIDYIFIPNSVTNIESEAFKYCNVTEIEFEEESQLTTINEKVFWGCDITSITIPNSVTYIGEDALGWCRELENIYFEEDSQLETIYDNVFEGCDSLESIVLPDSVKYVGHLAFYCENLKSVTLSKNLEYISSGAFVFSDSLENIYVPDDCENYKSIDGVLFTKDGKTLCCYPMAKKEESYVIPEGVEYVADSFFLCENLLSITIPASLKNIGPEAFKYCRNLSEIIFEEDSQLTSISWNAFTSCESLETFVVQEGVTYIGEDAFAYCKNLTTIIFLGDNIKTIEEDAFNLCENLTTIYFAGSEQQWNDINIYSGNEYLTNAEIIFNYASGE